MTMLPLMRTEEVMKYTQGLLTSSTFCIHNKAGGCETAQALLCFGLPSCPKVNRHANCWILSTMAALANQLAISLKHLRICYWIADTQRERWGAGSHNKKHTEPNESFLQFQISFRVQIKITFPWQTCFLRAVRRINEEGNRLH